MENGNKIVIASRDNYFKHGITKHLTEFNYQVVGDANTFNETRDLSERLKPNLVIMETELSNSDNVNYNGQLYLFTKKQDTLFFSDLGTKDLVERAIRFGAKGYLLKTDSPEDFLMAVNETINGKWYIPESLRNVESQIISSIVKPANGNGKLTPREWEVLDWVARGLANKEIAAQLGISARTVETHRERIMKKTDIHTIAGLTRYAIKTGRILLQ